MTRNCGESSTMSRRLFIASLFDGPLVNKHYRNIVADGINTFAFDALQRVPVRLELDLRLASRTREYFQEFLTDCHGLDLSKRHFCAGNAEAYHKGEHRSYMTSATLMTYTFQHVAGICTAIHLPPSSELF